MVAGVTDGGPADKAKIRNGDIILKFDGQDVKEMHTLPRIVADDRGRQGGSGGGLARRQGDDGQTPSGERPAEQQLAAADAGRKPASDQPTEISGLGLKVAPISQELKDVLSSAPSRRAW